MRIVPYDGEEDLDDIESMGILIRAVPFEGGFAPMFTLLAPSEDYFITLEEIHSLMDGVEIANERLDFLISEMISSRVGRSVEHPSMFDQDAEIDGGDFDEMEDEDDFGESD